MVCLSAKLRQEPDANVRLLGASLSIASGGLLFGLDLALRDLRRGCGAADLDPARLHLFGNFALEIDRQQAVLKAGASDLHVVS